jgi:alkyl sulfatase BDS1-like metallo-beta-lactamase superfamily hydrolase
LRTIGERTSAANIRNWCIARARHLDGSTPLDRLFGHRFTSRGLADIETPLLIQTMRVLLDPTLVEGLSCHIRFVIDGEIVGLHVRNCVAVLTSGEDATNEFVTSRAHLNSLFNNKAKLSDLLASGAVVVRGDQSAVVATLAAFEIDGLRNQ